MQFYSIKILIRIIEYINVNIFINIYDIYLIILLYKFYWKFINIDNLTISLIDILFNCINIKDKFNKE
jgi:hypothetical protein